METLRTPDEHFDGLPGFGWEPSYADVSADRHTVRMAYLDVAPDDGADPRGTVLLLHGEPSWSFLYRSMIGPLTAGGMRVVAPDLIGFGRSDKPASRGDYTYARHVAWTGDLVTRVLDLKNIILFCQDWGGLIGLRLVAADPDRFAAVVASNTFLPTGDRDPGDAFRAWCEFSQTVDPFPVGAIVNGGSGRELSEAEIAAYDAPFPDESFKEGARQFPALVPASPDDPESPANREAWERLAAFERPFLCVFGADDPITRGADRVLAEHVAGAAGQAHRTVAGAHFVQEDAGPELAAAVLELADGLPPR